MLIVLILAFACIIVGLVMVWGGRAAGLPALLAPVVFWVGVALVVAGLILLLAPVIVWCDGHLRAMLGTR